MKKLSMNNSKNPEICAHLFLTDYCSFVNLHRFVKFASVSNLDKFLFSC